MDLAVKGQLRTDHYEPLVQGGSSPRLFSLCLRLGRATGSPLRGFKLLISGVIFAALVSFLGAERVHTVNASVNLVASTSNNPQLDTEGSVPAPPQDETFLTYGVYPNIDLTSTGPRSNLRLAYSFGLNRVDSQTDFATNSHIFNGGVDAQLTQNLLLRISESFTRASDVQTFNLFRGVQVRPEGVFYDSETVSQHNDRRQNRVSINFDYTLNPKSSLTFGFEHSLLEYLGNSPSNSFLSDQNGFNGNLAYNRTMGLRTSWALRYSVSRYNYEAFDSARINFLSMSISRQLKPSVSLTFGTGPSYTESVDEQSGFFNWKNGSLTLSKTLENNLLSFSYSRQIGTSTGFGSVSDSQTFRFSFRRPLSRTTSVNAGVTLYDNEALLDNPVNNRGTFTSVGFNFLIYNRWSLHVGASYTVRQDDRQGLEAFETKQKRVFVSLRFTLPELLRF